MGRFTVRGGVCVGGVGLRVEGVGCSLSLFTLPVGFPTESTRAVMSFAEWCEVVRQVFRSCRSFVPSLDA